MVTVDKESLCKAGATVNCIHYKNHIRQIGHLSTPFRGAFTSGTNFNAIKAIAISTRTTTVILLTGFQSNF